MDTILVIIVLFVVLGLFGGVGLMFTRETGARGVSESARRFLNTSRETGKSIVAMRPFTPSTTSSDDGGTFESDAESKRPPAVTITPARRSTTAPVSTSESPAAVPLNDIALRELREEMQGELRRASGITREFDARLTRIEANSVDTPQLSTELTRSIEEHAAAQREELARLRDELASVRRATIPHRAAGSARCGWWPSRSRRSRHRRSGGSRPRRARSGSWRRQWSRASGSRHRTGPPPGFAPRARLEAHWRSRTPPFARDPQARACS